MSIFLRLYPWCWWAILAAFLVFEFVPLAIGKPQYTLSDYLWRLEEINQRWTALRYAIACLLGFAFLHITFGLFH